VEALTRCVALAQLREAALEVQLACALYYKLACGLCVCASVRNWCTHAH
jgi:hypothetical protein